MEKEVVYVAELDSDVDDVVAAHYLFNEGVLKCVVCDPYPRTPEGLARKGKLEALGIDVVKKMPPVAKYVFVGGALTAVAGYIDTVMLVDSGGVSDHLIVRYKFDDWGHTHCAIDDGDTVARCDYQVSIVCHYHSHQCLWIILSLIHI